MELGAGGAHGLAADRDRRLKSELGVRPVWHRKPQRIRSHLFLGVVAFGALHTLRWLAARGMHHRWRTIRNQLGGWKRVTSMLRTGQVRPIKKRDRSRKRCGSRGQSAWSRDCIAGRSRGAGRERETAQNVVTSASADSI